MNTDGTIKKLAVPLLLVSLPLTFMDVLLPIYTTELGYAPIQVTGLYSVFSFFLVVMRLFIGKMTDIQGRKSVLLTGILLYGLSYFFYSAADNIQYLYTARIFQSVAGVCTSISTFSMVADLNSNLGYNYGKIGGYTDRL